MNLVFLQGCSCNLQAMQCPYAVDVSCQCQYFYVTMAMTTYYIVCALVATRENHKDVHVLLLSWIKHAVN